MVLNNIKIENHVDPFSIGSIYYSYYFKVGLPIESIEELLAITDRKDTNNEIKDMMYNHVLSEFKAELYSKIYGEKKSDVLVKIYNKEL